MSVWKNTYNEANQNTWSALQSITFNGYDVYIYSGAIV